jgi:hypothetical protein
MKTTPVLVLLAGLALARCAGNDTVADSQAPVVAPLPALAPQSVAANAAQPGRLWLVRGTTCQEWLSRPEPERHWAAMFYYGWLAARAGTQSIDTDRIRPDLQRVMDRCAREPGLTVADAFTVTLSRPARWIWQQP